MFLLNFFLTGLYLYLYLKVRVKGYFRVKTRAYNKSYWKCIKNGEITAYGQHLDDLIKTEDGEWKINKRIIIHVW